MVWQWMWVPLPLPPISVILSGEVLASASLMNPQIRFGEDLMSRVSYVMMHPEGAEEMTAGDPRGVSIAVC